MITSLLLLLMIVWTAIIFQVFGSMLTSFLLKKLPATYLMLLLIALFLYFLWKQAISTHS